MNNSYRFFQNKECENYPCHKESDNFNCLFCYCPMYHMENCPGTPVYIEKDGRTIKVCSECIFPHDPNNYDKILEIIQ